MGYGVWGGVCAPNQHAYSNSSEFPGVSSVLGFGHSNLWKLTEPELAVTLPPLHPDRELKHEQGKPLSQDLALAAEGGSAPGHLSWRPRLFAPSLKSPE